MCVQCRERKVSALASLVHYQLSIISHQSRVEHPHRLLTSFSSSWMCVLVLYSYSTWYRYSATVPDTDQGTKVILVDTMSRKTVADFVDTAWTKDDTAEIHVRIQFWHLRWRSTYFIIIIAYCTTTVPGAILVSACDMWDMCLRTWASENPVHYVA